MKSNSRQFKVQRRRWRTRKKVVGTAERPRMSVKFTGKNIYVQFVDDGKGATLASVSTLHKSLDGRESFSANVVSAAKLGTEAAIRAKAAWIEQVVFDRSGAKYHGKVKALADAAREAGLKF